jgi:hypothetical protein
VPDPGILEILHLDVKSLANPGVLAIVSKGEEEPTDLRAIDDVLVGHKKKILLRIMLVAKNEARASLGDGSLVGLDPDGTEEELLNYGLRLHGIAPRDVRLTAKLTRRQ